MPLGLVKRGLVVSPPIEVFRDGFRVGRGGIDPQELRVALLFWDKLDCPTNNLVEIAPGPEADFLIRTGVMQRTRVQMGGSIAGGEVFRTPLVGVFQMLDQAEPGTWSIATGERSISFVDDEVREGRGALVTLHRALPVPDKDVPLDDILNFKRKRRSELLALRHHLEAIYTRVANAADRALTLNSEVEALERAVTNYIKSARGFGFKWRVADLGANLDLAGGAAAPWGTYQNGFSALDAVLAGAGAAIEIKAAIGLVRTRSPETPLPVCLVLSQGAVSALVMAV